MSQSRENKEYTEIKKLLTTGFDKVHGRINNLRSEMNRRFDEVDERLDNLEKKIGEHRNEPDKTEKKSGTPQKRNRQSQRNPVRSESIRRPA